MTQLLTLAFDYVTPTCQLPISYVPTGGPAETRPIGPTATATGFNQSVAGSFAMTGSNVGIIGLLIEFFGGLGNFSRPFFWKKRTKLSNVAAYLFM